MNEHRPIELPINPPDCVAEQCDHAVGEHPTAHTIACEACTFDGVDVGTADVIEPRPWPCEHGRPGKPDTSPGAADDLLAALRDSLRAAGGDLVIRRLWHTHRTLGPDSPGLLRLARGWERKAW